ncbi:NAD(P)-binding protein [Lindgomyces ingoldianus]|uniref:NAD(P)-binding protein n=1 Tax=Lindgomyces ingoldianus TaxID=673940 RepID=A0ACB6RCU6_9PLEO|nr:NAD(P)-binding protein [Lindgomyces ingoldianus]KAF2477084.1 NAD(P)-binding protein [Lindgomyces ingoldianus]
MASTSEPDKKNIQLEGKVIAITGANQEIGLGIADCCLSNGASKVYSVDIGSPGNEFSNLQLKYPDQFFSFQANVTKEESISVDHILSETGAIHGMVCNAGRTKHMLALEFTTEEVEQLWGVNRGRSLNSASMASYRPNKQVPSAPYGASKAGARNMQLKYYGGIPRFAEVEELGGAYVYLLSDAASYTMGIDIPINGVIGIC